MKHNLANHMKYNLTYAEFIGVLVERLIPVMGKKLSVTKTKQIVETITGYLIDQVINHEARIMLPSLGVFHPVKRKQRTMRLIGDSDPNRTCKVPGQLKIGFRAGKAAKRKMSVT